MNREKGFAEDLEAISTNVENEVGRYVKLLRNDTALAANSPGSAKVAKTATQQEPKTEDRSANGTGDASPADTRTRTSPRPRQKAAPTEKVVRENVSLRLRPETNELLTEAALRQKLKKEPPDSRQDIADVALWDWFRKHGYAK